MAADTQVPIFTSSDRIKQLNDIDNDVAKLLHSAGSAIKALTSSQEEDESQSQSSQSTEQQMTEFTKVTSQYFSLLSSIDVRLRRQIYALEEADIIPAEVAAKAEPASTASFGLGSAPSSQLNVPPSSAGTTRGQVGGNFKSTSAAAGGPVTLDVGWLNSRNDSVGKDMEAELWAKAKEFLEGFEESVKERDRGDEAFSFGQSQG